MSMISKMNVENINNTIDHMYLMSNKLIPLLLYFDVVILLVSMAYLPIFFKVAPQMLW